MMQLQRAGSVVEALKAMVPASALSAAAASRVTALAQTSPADADADIDGVLNATYNAGHEDHGGGILQTMEGLLEKAEAQLDTARTTETSNLHNFAMLRQSWTEQIKAATQDAGKTEKGISEAEEAKAILLLSLALQSQECRRAFPNEGPSSSCRPNLPLGVH